LPCIKSLYSFFPFLLQIDIAKSYKNNFSTQEIFFFIKEHYFGPSIEFKFISYVEHTEHNEKKSLHDKIIYTIKWWYFRKVIVNYIVILIMELQYIIVHLLSTTIVKNGTNLVLYRWCPQLSGHFSKWNNFIYLI
jgi:hypothetical protein